MALGLSKGAGNGPQVENGADHGTRSENGSHVFKTRTYTNSNKLGEKFKSVSEIEKEAIQATAPLQNDFRKPSEGTAGKQKKNYSSVYRAKKSVRYY